MAEDHAAKLAVARNAAYLVEHEVKDPMRAFRAYLNAFRLAPDDAEISGHLWRLAALIGRYEPAPTISKKVARRLDALDADADADRSSDRPRGAIGDEEATTPRRCATSPTPSSARAS